MKKYIVCILCLFTCSALCAPVKEAHCLNICFESEVQKEDFVIELCDQVSKYYADQRMLEFTAALYMAQKIIMQGFEDQTHILSRLKKETHYLELLEKFDFLKTN